MEENIGIGMTGESKRIGNLNSAENEFPPAPKGMDIKSLANAIHVPRKLHSAWSGTDPPFRGRDEGWVKASKGNSPLH